MYMHQQSLFHLLVSGGSRYCWESTLYYVVEAFKMTERVEQQIYIKFRIKLEHSSTDPQTLFGWFRSLQLWATGDWLLHHDNVPAHVLHLMQRGLAKHQIAQVTQPSYSLNLVSRDFCLFPKLKSPLKGKRFQLSMRFRKICWHSWWWSGEL